MPQKCYAFGCTKNIRPGLLMCLEHWNQVPVVIQRWVYSSYRDWQARGPMTPYLAARERAFLATAEAQGASETALKIIRAEVKRLETEAA